MTADDRGATVPEAHIPLHAVARAMVRHRLDVPLDSASLDALAWAVTRTPEGRDKVLTALVETGTLTEERIDRPAFVDTGEPLPPTAARLIGEEPRTRHTLTIIPSRRLVTEWTEVEP